MLSLLPLVLCVLALPQALGQRPTCAKCLASGYAYFCKASITSHLCFQEAGDAQCNSEMCVCCKNKKLGGCVECETVDEDDLDEEGEQKLEQADAWQSHDMRARMERERKETNDRRNRELFDKSIKREPQPDKRTSSASLADEKERTDL